MILREFCMNGICIMYLNNLVKIVVLLCSGQPRIVDNICEYLHRRYLSKLCLLAICSSLIRG